MVLLIAGFIIKKLKLSVTTDKASGSSRVDGLTSSMRAGSLSLLFARVFCEPASKEGQREEWRLASSQLCRKGTRANKTLSEPACRLSFFV